MTATTITARSTSTTRPIRAIWATTAVSGLAAAVATTVIAAVAKAADVGLDVDGESIPTIGFAQMTLLGAVIGGIVATVLAKWARRPRRTFVLVTGVLTALSLVPDVTMGFDVASALVLIATHLVAAAIVVPAVARRLAA